MSADAAGAPAPLGCPFCGAPESDRFVLEGRRFLVFPCQFTAEVDPALDEAGIARLLSTEYRSRGPAFFRGTCDRLHLYVTKGAGARALEGTDPSRA